MKRLWDKECKILQNQLKIAPDRDHNKIKKTLKRYQNVAEDIKEACFRRYIKACKQKHALQFFAWRDKYAVQRHQGLASAVFQSRIGWMVMKKKQAERLMGVEEHELDEILEGEQAMSQNGSSLDVINQTTQFNNQYGDLTPNKMLSAQSNSNENSVFNSKRSSTLRPNFTNVSHEVPNIQNRTEISKYTQEAGQITKQTVYKIKQIKLVLETVASGEDPEIIVNIDICQSQTKSLINSFEEINLNDPFPAPVKPPPPITAVNINKALGNKKGLILKNHCEHEEEEKETEFQLFDPNYRLNEFSPPIMLFVPCRPVMTKLMNLCASVSDFSDLFYFL